MPSFKDLTTDAGLQELNTHLATRSYIEGYKVSGADASLLSQIKAAVDHTKYPHVARWLAHISSFPPCTLARLAGSCCPVAGKSASSAAACPASAAAAPKKAAKSDDDFLDLSDSDDDDDAAAAIIAKKEAEKKAKEAAEAPKKKKEVIAKSTVVIDIKPCDSETDLGELEKQVRAIAMDGLLWGVCQREPVAYGVFKLRMGCVIEDEKVGLDDLQEQIEEIEDVQSTDILSFQKI